MPVLGGLRLAGLAAVAGLAGLLAVQPAHAALGESLSTQKRAQGVRSLGPGLRYEVREIRAGDGSVLREFVTPAGVVFAVSWRSHLKPQVSSLLGQYHPSYVQATRAATPPRGFRRQNFVNTGDLVVHESVQLGQFVGRAYAQRLVPAGVDVDALR